MAGGAMGLGNGGLKQWLSNNPNYSNCFIAVTAALGYICTYFIRYPMFVLPNQGAVRPNPP